MGRRDPIVWMRQEYSDLVLTVREHARKVVKHDRIRGGSGGGSAPEQLTANGMLSNLKIQAKLTSSGNTLTLTPIDNGIIPLYGDAGQGWVNTYLLSPVNFNAAGSTSGRLYDIYVYYDQVTSDPPAPALEAVIWTNETTRSVAISTQDGATLKSTDTTRRLVAICRYNGSTMLVPSIDPNGELFFGTGDPRDNTSNPFSGVGMSAGGVTFGAYVWQFFAALNGVVGVGFNALGQLVAGAGSVLLDALGVSIVAGTAYTAAAAIKFVVGSLNLFSIYATTDVGSPKEAYLDFDSGTSGINDDGSNTFYIRSQTKTTFLSRMNLISSAASSTQAQIRLDSGGGAQTRVDINPTGTDCDTQVRGDTDTALLYVDASTDRVGIGTSTPSAKFNVEGAVIINDLSADVDVRIEGNGDANLFFTDGGTDRVGIGNAAPTEKLDVTGNGKFSGTLNVGGATTLDGNVTLGNAAADTVTFSGTPAGLVVAGTYTPTLTNTTNVAASTSAQCNYMRVGNIVTVSGRIAIDPTAAVATLLEISLPIPSNFGGAADCGGVAACGSVASMSAAIDANTTNDTANLSYIATDLANRVWSFTFTYEVI